jgi:maltooligosyltrehalose trehalohydrolase
MKIGAGCGGSNTCEFTIWATKPEKVSLKIVDPFEMVIPMYKDEFDYWQTVVNNIPAGAKYYYTINNSYDRPDPASHYQPDGVHGASEVVNHAAFNWSDNNWKGINPEDLIIYELHIGTFTQKGTFESAITKLDYLAELGITAIEIMPVSQFPGRYNWGYDGCYPYAPQNSYGGPEGLKRLVDAAHKKGIAVILDVVYNHFGPEGSYADQFAHYFTPGYRTPWGSAINYDDEYSYGVRNYFLENVRHWLVNYHIDGLRLDAVDTIYDLGAKHFLQELSEEVLRIKQEEGKEKFLIAESDLNDIKIIKPVSECGYGIDLQWSDNFHHSVHALITGEASGYYIDFGKTEHLVKSLSETFYYSGKFSVYRKKYHGNSAIERPPYQFVICLQNHDQVGNRPFGERLSALVSYDMLKVSAALMILSPYTPLLFMGEEYGEENPFLYFVSHTDKELIKAVQAGRKEEFSSFSWEGEIPDPFAETTFVKSKLNWHVINEAKHNILLDFYRNLIRLRKKHPALQNKSRKNFEVKPAGSDKTIQFIRSDRQHSLLGIFNLNNETVTTLINFPPGDWKKILDSSSEKWLGPGESASAEIIGKDQNITIKKASFVLYEMERK